MNNGPSHIKHPVDLQDVNETQDLYEVALGVFSEILDEYLEYVSNTEIPRPMVFCDMFSSHLKQLDSLYLHVYNKLYSKDIGSTRDVLEEAARRSVGTARDKGLLENVNVPDLYSVFFLSIRAYIQEVTEKSIEKIEDIVDLEREKFFGKKLEGTQPRIIEV